MNLPTSSPPGTRWRNWVATGFCAFATVAMLGDLIGSRVVKGLGGVSAAAPFPKVFCEFEGMEGFAAEFTIVCETPDGPRTIPITPELYSRLAGPYNRRNVYGAALAGGPKLPRSMWEAVFRHGFGPGGPLRAEFGLPPDATNVFVVVRTKTKGRQEQWLLQPEEDR